MQSQIKYLVVTVQMTAKKQYLIVVVPFVILYLILLIKLVQAVLSINEVSEIKRISPLFSLCCVS